MSFFLFNEELSSSLAHPTQLLDSHAPTLPAGAYYQPDFLSEKEEARLLFLIDSSSWITDLKRRVQHYGYRYDYRSRNINYSMFLGPLPHWANYFAHKLYQQGLMPHIADQVIVNEYLPGQGISPHIDCTPCFEDSIVSISLGSSCVMNLIRLCDKKQIDVLLPERSVMSLCGEARYEWQHGIKSLKTDIVNDVRIPRSRRVSLTFRKVKLAHN